MGIYWSRFFYLVGLGWLTRKTGSESNSQVGCIPCTAYVMIDFPHSTFNLETSDDETMQQLYGHSITYRIAIGPNQGKKVFTLQTLPPVKESKVGSSRVAKVAGLFRASCPPPFGPAFGCSKSLPAI